ncbi:MAG: [FeFe] hydrogenase H-cluster maturation GTPase HydF [Eubacterium sp.]
MAENLNQTPNANRLHIGFFGRRNAGKSSVVNAVTGQNLSIISDVKGTTTDPVLKAMELLPIGPVVIIDTPGIDDEGALGMLRVQKTKQILNKTDIAVLVSDSALKMSEAEENLIALFKEKKIPYVIVYNKSDLSKKECRNENELCVSAKTGENIYALKEKITVLAKQENITKRIICDKLSPQDTVLLVTPIDASAPKGRMILPQVQVIREVLDSRAVCITVQPEQLKFALENLKSPPVMVITDSQVFGKVKQLVPQDILLTSFSILFANFKGILKTAVQGAAGIDKLKNGDTVLISEGCTHHRQCEDIGTVKLPAWLKNYTGKDLRFAFTSGSEFPQDLSRYSLVIHCGGCMLNEREMLYRQKCAAEQGVLFTNYGTAIAYMNGILKRSLEVFPEILAELN